MLIDLHTHTYPLSWDSQLAADELVERSKEAGLDGIVLSEHDWAWNPEEVRALGERHDFLVLHGIEVNTDDGHILVIGPRRYTYGMHHTRELARLVQEADGVMWAAHPNRRLRRDRRRHARVDHEQARENSQAQCDDKPRSISILHHAPSFRAASAAG